MNDLLILLLVLSPISMILGYIASARNSYKAKRVRERKGAPFRKWLPTYNKKNLELLRGGKEAKRTVGNYTYPIVTEPDYSIYLYLTLCCFFGIWFFLVSLAPMMPKEEPDNEE